MKNILLISLCSIPLAHFSAAQAQQIEWVQQFGTSDGDFGLGVSSDSQGNLYVSGAYEQGNGSAYGDGFLAKYDANGVPLWSHQIGTSAFDASTSVSVDRLGNVFVGGNTQGNLGGVHFGNEDAFISKYDISGNLQWTRQLGSSGNDADTRVAADGLGNVYLSGWTSGSLAGTNYGGEDGFLAKYDSTGVLQWTRQFGTSRNEYQVAIAAEASGNVYVGGSTYGPQSGSGDAYLAKYDAAGTQLWTRQFGATAADDTIYGLSLDASGNVFLAGHTEGSLWAPNAGAGDAFLAKYDADGTLQWGRQFGSGSEDWAPAILVDEMSSSVYVSGSTSGSLQGTNAGDWDLFAANYDLDGNVQWIRQFGTSENDSPGFSLAVDGLDNLIVTGGTTGNWGTPNIGGRDAFVLKLSTIPEPSTTMLAVLCLTGTVAFRRRSKRWKVI